VVRLWLEVLVLSPIHEDAPGLNRAINL
jgi:hypothetical protein